MLVLLLISFFVAGAEVAFFSLTYKDINMLKTKQHPAARRIISLLEHPKTLLASLLTTNSFVNIGIIIMSNFVIDEFMTIEASYFWVEFLIKVIAVTFLLVLFGEILPKVWATQNNIRFAYNASLLVEVVNSVFKGFSHWLVGFSDRIERGLGSRKSNTYSLQELDHAIDLTTHQDATEEEKNILKGIVKFGNITVKQIMKTRLEVSGRFQHLFRRIDKAVEDSLFALPVYKQNLTK
jgi:Mg2+/Co2+ transporter CorB